MLLITAYIEVAPADRETIRRPLADIVAATRTEDGCEEYGCYEDLERPGRYVFVERWRDRAALDRHMKSPHMAAWMTTAGGKLTSATATVYDIAGTIDLRP